MSAPAERYRVTYSERVRAGLWGLVARARARGEARQVLDAIREIDRRLQIYPQFGEPLSDLQIESGQLWIAVVPPLVVRYAIIESERLVAVGVPLQEMSGPGAQSN